MNKIAKRTWFALALAGVLLLGLLLIVIRYMLYSPAICPDSRDLR